HQPRDVAHGVRDIAEDQDLRPLCAAGSEDELRREAAGGEVLANGPADGERALAPRLAPAGEPGLQPLGEAPDDIAHALDLLRRERGEIAVEERVLALALRIARFLLAIGDPLRRFLESLHRGADSLRDEVERPRIEAAFLEARDECLQFLLGPRPSR